MAPLLGKQTRGYLPHSQSVQIVCEQAHLGEHKPECEANPKQEQANTVTGNTERMLINAE